MISLTPGQKYDLGSIPYDNRIKPMNCNGWNPRYNVDGFLTYSAITEEGSDTYAELFRNGILESVSAVAIWKRKLFSLSYEHRLIESLTDYLGLLNDLTIELPIFLFLSLLGVRGCAIDTSGISRYSSLHAPRPIDRDIVLLPEVIIEDYSMPAEVILTNGASLTKL